MVIGDPYRFAIIVDLVDSWCAYESQNGIFFFCVGGKPYPKEIDTVSLAADLHYFFDVKPSALLDVPENAALFDAGMEYRFKKLYKEAYPDEGDMDFTYKCSLPSMRDSGYDFFAVRKGDKVKITGSRVTDEVFTRMNEVTIPADYVKRVMDELKEFYQKHF